jgi:hypothetical protein
VRKLLFWECRYVMLTRPDHLAEEDRENLRFLLESPVGEQVGLVREFLEGWCRRSSTISSATDAPPKKRRIAMRTSATR